MRFTWSLQAGEQLLKLDAETRDGFFQRLESELDRRKRPRRRSRRAADLMVPIAGLGKVRVRRFGRSVWIVSIQLDAGATEP